MAETRPVRPGEELNQEALEAYLTQVGFPGPWQVTQFPAGHSNLTYLLTSAERELVLRRPPMGNQVKSAHDMGREYRVLSKLAAVYPPAPRPLHYCDNAEVLGSPFYLMERRPGLVLRSPLPKNFDARPEVMRELSLALIDNLAALHQLDYAAAGLADLGKPQGYVARQVAGWVQRYEAAQTEELPSMRRAADWLKEQQPGESRAALVHNDYKFDNIAVDPRQPTRIVAVFDWEMATIGDPLLDLGTTLAYWVEAADGELLPASAVGPTNLPGCPTRAELLARYEEKTGTPVADVRFYRTFGLFKIAVIIQQIYARYLRGSTRDERFAGLGQNVRTVADVMDRIIRT